MLGVEDAAMLGSVHSAMLARVAVSSDSDMVGLRLSMLVLSDEIWDVATIAVDLAVKWPLTQGCVCQ